MREECLAAKVVRVFNKLPAAIKDLPMLRFKKELKKWIRQEVPVRPP